MEYNSYYEQPKEPKKNGGRSMGVVILITAVICLVVGALIAGVIVNNQNNNTQQLAMATATPTTAQTDSGAEVTSTTPVPLTTGSAGYNAGQNPVATIYATLEPSVVSVEVSGIVSSGRGEQTEELIGAGSGFIITADGYIVTNAHVVESATSAQVELNTGEKVDAQIIGYDTIMDVAVLKIEKSGLTPVTLGDSDVIHVGDTAVAIGNMLGSGMTVSSGVVSATNRKVSIDGMTYEYIQTDTAINEGNSGGPLVNANSEVIGIYAAKRTIASYDIYGNATSAEGVSYAIPINKVKDIIQKLITNGKVERPGIGVSVYMLDETSAQEYGVPVGILVSGVTSGSPAYEAGLQANDVITQIDGQTVESLEWFTSLIQAKNVGDTISITVYRDGQYYQASVTIGDLNQMSGEITPEVTPTPAAGENPFLPRP